MSIWQPGDEDTLSFEANTNPQDLRNIYITLDEQNPSQALRLKIGNVTGVLGADEALTLLDWLQEREGTLFELVKQQPTLSFDQDTETSGEGG
jgi:hypothetical protein